VSQPDVLARSWPWRASLTLGPWRSAVPCGPALAVACLAGWGLSTARDSVELVVSELLTNATTASDAPGTRPAPGEALAPGRRRPDSDHRGRRERL